MSLIKAPHNYLFFNSLSATAQGIMLALISSALFVGVGIIVRTLSASIDPFQILLFRQIVFITLLLPAIASNIQILLKPNKVGLHILRISGAFISLYFGFLTISNLPFADATALGFIQVLFVALISRLFLSEQINSSRKFTIIVGFIGVMFIVKPTFAGAQSIYIASGVLAALGAAVAVTCVRKVAQTEPRITLLAYQALFVALLALTPAIYTWQWPTFTEWGLLILVGVISSIAQWIGINAYKLAEANVVANVEYVKIIYSLLIGYWLFAELPDTVAMLGATLIISSAILPNLQQIRRKKSDKSKTLDAKG